MKRIFLFLEFLFITFVLFAQKPNFDLVGFGSGTTGGAGGSTVTVTNYADFAANVVGTDKKIIKISGTITGPGGGVILDIGSNKTIIGIGSNSMISMVNLHLKNSQQIIIQNIRFSMIGSTLGSDADMISIETTSTNEVKNIWIDHCEFFNIRPTLPESASKKDLYDGMIDIKKSSSLITISWNYFHDHWKGSLIGFNAEDVYDRKITYHHNYFKDIKSRAPSYRGGTGHIYNNFYDGLNDPNEPSSDGINSREKACLKVESNYFRNYVKSIYCALDDVTFEGFAYGENNIFENSGTKTASSCSSFTPPYNYTADKTADVPGIVASWSGVGKLDAVAYSLTTSITGQGSIELEPAGGNYPAGTTVTLKPVPAADFKFVNWNGAVTGSASPTTLVVNGNKAVNATFSSVLGIEENELFSNSFISYPSPISHSVNLRFFLNQKGDLSISIKDNTGRTVLTPPLGSIIQGYYLLSVDMSTLEPGLYYCVIQNGNTLFTKVLMKE